MSEHSTWIITRNRKFSVDVKQQALLTYNEAHVELKCILFSRRTDKNNDDRDKNKGCRIAFI